MTDDTVSPDSEFCQLYPYLHPGMVAVETWCGTPWTLSWGPAGRTQESDSTHDTGECSKGNAYVKALRLINPPATNK